MLSICELIEGWRWRGGARHYGKLIEQDAARCHATTWLEDISRTGVNVSSCGPSVSGTCMAMEGAGLNMTWMRLGYRKLMKHFDITDPTIMPARAVEHRDKFKITTPWHLVPVFLHSRQVSAANVVSWPMRSQSGLLGSPVTVLFLFVWHDHWAVREGKWEEE
jgi:hypothetical protein